MLSRSGVARYAAIERCDDHRPSGPAPEQVELRLLHYRLTYRCIELAHSITALLPAPVLQDNPVHR